MVLAKRGPEAIPPSPPPAGNIPPDCTDLAVSCLALARGSPPIGDLTSVQFKTALLLSGLILRAYRAADYEAFLALRSQDLDYAERVRKSDLERLRALAREAGAVGDEPLEDWPEALEAFWTAFYAHPPVARWIPEGTRYRLGDQFVRPSELDSWSQAFEAFVDGFPGRVIQHDLVVPHEGSMEQIVRRSPLHWFDLGLEFESQMGVRVGVALRFVWDPYRACWFLQRACSSYPNGHDPWLDRAYLIL